MAWFDSFRDEPYPTQYPPRKSAVTADVLEIGLAYAIAILAFSLFIIVPGWAGKQGLYHAIRNVVGLFVVGSIVLVNYGQEWEVAHLTNVRIQYRAGIVEEIQADIGLKISLRSINITLKTHPEEQTFSNGTVNERINYNERFSWDNEGWVQGRMGFGPHAGLFNREYRAAQEKGLPYPILWIAEYFTLDGEWIRWGRFYRQAGYYTHIMIWLAFALWILTLLLFKMVLDYAAIMSLLTGVSLILANIIYALMRNKNELIIPLTAEAVLNPRFGWCFWLCLINGILTIIIGVVILVLTYTIDSNKLDLFFNKDYLQNLDQFYADSEEADRLIKEKRKRGFRGFSRKYILKDEESVPDEPETEGNHAADNPEANSGHQRFRKRTIIKNADKEFVRSPKPAPRHAIPQKDDDDDDDGDDYENSSVAVRYKPNAQGEDNLAFNM